MSRRLRIFTWHIHGSYLYYLSHANVDFYLPKGEGEGYGGRTASFPWGDNVYEIPKDEVKSADFDVILFQHRKNYLEDQYEILSERQRQLPKIYLEHDPPQDHPTNTRHFVDDPNILLVHVTNFNRLMWDNNRTPTAVIEHGVMVGDDVHYTGELGRGIVVVNNIAKRGRRLGLDVFEQKRRNVPLDLVGMDSQAVGGLGEVPPEQLPAFASRYRFFFNPIRYTSLGLAVCEAMAAGLPIVGLATTELPTVVENGKTGFISTDPEELTAQMQLLLNDKALAQRMSAQARRYARQRFGIGRFAHDWERIFHEVAASRQHTAMKQIAEKGIPD